MEIKVNQAEKRSWVEINIDQLKLNYQTFKSLLPESTDIMAVVKADGYGHGDVQTAKLFASLGCRSFAVSNIDEAVGLRESGIEGEILILGYTSPRYARILYHQNLTQAIVSEEYARTLKSTGYRIKCQVAIDTGMKRIGIDGGDTEKCEDTIRELTIDLDINGIFTHLCVADDLSQESYEFTINQIRQFRVLAEKLHDLKLPFIHCFNSAGAMYYLPKEIEDSPIKGIVRLGIVLYGCKPDRSNVLPENIKNVLEWKSKISMVKMVRKGESIGYGRTFITTKDSVIATVTTGYADGLSRILSNNGYILVNGHKAPIVGRICMDQTLIDVTDIPDVKMGDTVTLLGNSNGICYYVDDMADDLDTIGYEVLCNISKRVQRFYKTKNLLYTV